MELEPDYNKDCGKTSGTIAAYSVEARYAFSKPISIAGVLFDNRWRKVDFEWQPNEPPPSSWRPRRGIHQENFGLLEYPQAEALRWWLQAQANSVGDVGGMCLNTRIIKHEIKYSSECVAVSQHNLIGGDDRSNCIPDWDKKHRDNQVLREFAARVALFLESTTERNACDTLYSDVLSEAQRIRDAR